MENFQRRRIQPHVENLSATSDIRISTHRKAFGKSRVYFKLGYKINRIGRRSSRWKCGNVERVFGKIWKYGEPLYVHTGTSGRQQQENGSDPLF